MSPGGHKTSAIQRPKDATRSRTRPVDRPDETQHGERMSDFTRPIAREKQLVKGRAKRGVIALAATVITAALVAALFVLPEVGLHRQQEQRRRDRPGDHEGDDAEDEVGAPLSCDPTIDADRPGEIAESGTAGVGRARAFLRTLDRRT